ncbi:MAG: lytic transglycosylase domain-containing protein [Alphaproteobacteria bacterium]
MNISYVVKKSAHFGVSALMMGILLLPVQAAERLPIPTQKPVLLDGSIVPIPSVKPYNITESSLDVTGKVTFESMTLNLASLFSTDIISGVNKGKTYSNGYVALSGEQSKIYAKIFEAQAVGNMDLADDLLNKVRDKRLLGHVLYQRYMHPSYTSKFSELKNWMAEYSDYPGAKNIYKMALSKQVNDSEETVVKARTGRVLSQINEPTIYHPKRYISKTSLTDDQREAESALSKNVTSLIRSKGPLVALTYFKDSPARSFIDKVSHDKIQSKIAASFLYRGRFESAYKLAAKSADRSGKYVPHAGWIAGLASWQMGNFSTAAAYFEKTGNSAYASGWMSSAGLFWAARSYDKLGDKRSYNLSLVKAAKHSRTFYGLMAKHKLGQDLDFNWEVPEYNDEHETLILSHDIGKRVYSLVAAGQYDLAESELMRLDYKKNIDLSRAVLAYASHVGLPGVALRLGNMVKRGKNKYYDSALYPVSPWSPQDGYRVDPALVHAVIRQESRFNLQATSYSGAIGLMQIMPKTAQYVADTKKYPEDLNMSKLRLPEMNMKVGQDYIEYLLNGRYVKGDVVSLLVSYNAGPGNLLKWRKRMGDNKDPLLFIEMMPVHETRDYVERVMSNYWIYRLRAGLKLPSLTALANGKSPKYAHVMQAEYPYKLAANQ